MSSNKHIKDAFSPLRTLCSNALRRFGDFSPSSVQGDVASMFIEFANLVVDDWRMHPNIGESCAEIDHYMSVDEAREIPDSVVLHGLLMHYAFQQMSEKAGIYQGMYYQALNREAYRVLTRNSNPRLEFQEIR